MARLILAAAGVILLAVAALTLVWLSGQLLTGLGAFVSGTAAVLWRLLGFLIVAGGLGGLAYFLASAWRPSARAAASGAGRPGAEPPAQPTVQPTAPRPRAGA